MSRTSTDQRRADLAMIHIAAKALFGDVGKTGAGREDYEGWLLAKTGKRSSGDLTAAERSALIKALRKDGVIPDRPRGGTGQTVGGVDRPTSKQWAAIAGFAREIGWSNGLEDKRLKGFIKRTAKVDDTRFLSRHGASQMVLGLKALAKKKEEEGDEMPAM